MEELIAELETLLAQLEDRAELEMRLAGLTAVYPFNQYELLITTLVGRGVLSLDEYHRLRAAYLARNQNLPLFEINAPRAFGETWAQTHLQSLVPALVKPSKRVDPHYSGQYDFLLPLDGAFAKIEVKASRAVDLDSRAALVVRALASDTHKRFDMNFQQIKPDACDVFVWIAVWRDKITYWVLSSNEVSGNRYYSRGQHRGNVGEGQLHIHHDNIELFAPYETLPEMLLQTILNAHKRQLH